MDYLSLHLRDPGVLTELLFKYWTLKEAYTKALGIGLGFDFKRVEYRIDCADKGNGSVLVDGTPLSGWAFQGFHFVDGSDRYSGMVAKATGDSGARVLWAELSRCEWVEHVQFLDLLKRARATE